MGKKEYHKSIIDTLPEHIAIVDNNGVIVQVNESWKRFARENEGTQHGGVGTSYLVTCDSACSLSSDGAQDASNGIKAVITGEVDSFQIEYPCHAPHRKRWFIMMVAPHIVGGEIIGAVVSHFDITERKILELQLEAKEKHFRSIADYAIDWEWWVSPEGTFLHVSSSVEEITGYSAEEFLRDPNTVDRILHPEDRERYSPSMLFKISEAGNHYDEFRIIKPDGEVVWIGHLCRPVYGEAGEWLGRRATNRDITTQKNLEHQLRLDEAIISSTPNVISTIDADYVYQAVNRTYEENFAVSSDQIVGKTVAQVMGDEVFEGVIKARLDRCLAGEVISYDSWFDFPGTGRRYMSILYYPYKNSQNEIMGVVVSGTDITELQETKEKLENSEHQLRVAQAISKTGNFERTLKTGTGYWSDQMYELLGYPSTIEPEFEHVVRRVHPDDREGFLAVMDGAIKFGGEHDVDFRVVLPGDKVLHLQGSLVVRHDADGPASYHGVVKDVTELKQAQAKLIELATTDPLTGVANRRTFAEVAEREISRSVRYKQDLSLLVIDLDHFKSVNDTYGHDAGDVVLREMTALASRALRDVDTLARMGGEEFAVLLPATSLEGAAKVAERIRGKLHKADIDVGSTEIRVTASIGVSVLLENMQGIDELLKAADAALYRAKESGRNRVCLADGNM